MNIEDIILLPHQNQNNQSRSNSQRMGYTYSPNLQQMPISTGNYPVWFYDPFAAQNNLMWQQQQLMASQNQQYYQARIAIEQLHQKLAEEQTKNARLTEENHALKKQISQVQPVLYDEDADRLNPLSGAISVPRPSAFIFEKQVLELPSKGLNSPLFLHPLRPGIELGEESHLYFQQYIPYLLEEIRAGLYAQLEKIQHQQLRPFTTQLKLINENQVALEALNDYFVEIKCGTLELPQLNHDFSCEAVFIMTSEQSSRMVASQKGRQTDSPSGILAIASSLRNSSITKDGREEELTLLILKSDYEKNIHFWQENQDNRIQVHWLYGLLPSSHMFQSCYSMPKFFLESQLIQGKLDYWPSHEAKESAGEDNDVTISQDNVLECLGSMDAGFYCLQGPPGTGKTTTIVNLLVKWAREHPNERILLCAPSNQAVQVVLNKLKPLLPDVTMALMGSGKQLSEDLADVFISGYAKQLYEPLINLKSNNTLSTEELKTMLIAEYDRIYQKLVALVHERNRLVNRPVQQKIWQLEAYFNQEKQGLLDLQNSDKERILARLEMGILQLKDSSHMFEYFLMQRAQIVFSTLVASGREWLKKQIGNVDRLIIDEAAQALVPETFIPLRLNPKMCILVGDPKQLPATLGSRAAKEAGFDKSLMQSLIEDCQQPYKMLDTQYRMNLDICSWPSRQYYNGRLKTGDSVMGRASLFENTTVHSFFHRSTCFFNISSGKEERNLSGSFLNQKEALAIVKTVSYLLKCGLESAQIGIITFYAAQVEQIMRNLRRMIDLGRIEEKKLKELTVNTIDSFQGGERDMIVISAVRSGRDSVGFLDDGRRVNVAMTRAKSSLFIFGNGERLVESTSDLSDFIQSRQPDEIVSEKELNQFTEQKIASKFLR